MARTLAPHVSHRWEAELCVVRAASREDLLRRAGALRDFVAGNSQVRLIDLAFTLTTSDRDAAAATLCLVASSLDDLEAKLQHAGKRLADPTCHRIRDVSGIYFFDQPWGGAAELAYLFPGEGAQYPSMLGDLCLAFPEVRRWFDLMDRAFRDHARGFMPSQVIFGQGSSGGTAGQADALWDMASAIESVFAADQAMNALLGCLGLRPQAMVGHSAGEYSSLLASGAARVDDDAELISHILNGNAVTELVTHSGALPRGVLLSVSAASGDLVPSVRRRYGEDLELAMDNCPQQVILCAEPAIVESVQRDLEAGGALCQRLPFERAYHTPAYGPVRDQLRAYYDAIRFARPQVRCYSCAIAAPFPADPEEIRRLALDQWIRPVRFRETIEAMYADGIRIFVEVGPRGNLTAFVDDILRGRPHLAVPSNVQARSGIVQLQNLLGLLAANRIDLHLDRLYEQRGAQPLEQELIWNGRPLPSSGSPPTTLSLALPLIRLDGETPSPAAAAQGGASLLTPVAVPPAPASQPALAAYFDTMRQFLDVEAAVVTAYVQRSRPDWAPGHEPADGDARAEAVGRFQAFVESPADLLAGVSWRGPLARSGLSASMQCCRVDFPTDLSEADARHWEELLADVALAPAERARWAQQANARRRREWLIGRLAAKDAVRLMLKGEYGVRSHPADIVIESDSGGPPRAAGGWARQCGGEPALSITHSSLCAAALAGDGRRFNGIGIDVEPLAHAAQAMETAIAAPEEMGLLAALPAPLKGEWALRIWCAKEAAAKSLGLGLIGGGGSLLVRRLDQDDGLIELDAAEALRRRRPQIAGASIRAYSDRDGDLVVATAAEEAF